MLILLRCIFCVSFFFFFSQVHAAESLEKIVLQLPWHHQFQFAGYYAAVHQGYYKDAGFDVTLKSGGPNKSSIEEVVSGRAEYGVARSELLLHRLKGKPVVALAAMFQHSAIIMLARKDSGINTPHDMIGRRVMLLEGDDAAEYIAMFQSEGVPLEKINILRSSLDINDLIQKKTDVFNAYITNEPFYLEQQNIPFTIIKPSSYGIDFYGDTLFTSERELSVHSERVKAFRAASIRGWEFALSHHEEIISILIDTYQVSSAKSHLHYEADSIHELILPDLVEIGHMNPGRWQHMADIFVELGMVDPGYSLDGFLYDPTPEADYTLIYRLLSIAVSIVILIVPIAIALFLFNRRLTKEISQREQAEEILRIEKDNLNNIFEAMEDGVYIVNQQYDIQYANPMLQKEFGSYDGRKCYEYFQDRKEVCPWCRNHEVFAGKTVRWEWFSPKNQKKYDLIDTPLKNFDESISKLEIFRDITERKQAEKALLASENRFRSLVNELPNIAGQGYDGKRTVVFWNDASVKLYGYTTHEALGRKLEDLIIPKPMKKAVIEGIRDWYENNVAIPSSELTLCHKDGSDVEVYSSHIMQVDTQGKKIMYCVDVDLTEQKHAQEAVQTLMRSTVGLTGQAYFDLVVQELCRWTNVDSANIGILTPDDRVDAIALQLDGEMIRDFIYPLAGSPCVEVINKGTRVFPENVCHLFPNDEELTELNAQGYAGVPIQDNKGEPLGIMWMVSRRPMHLPPQWQAVMEIIAARTGAEIERLLAEQERQKATDQMLRMQKLESVGVLAGGIAHDFNNILSAILGNIELASLRIESEDAELASLLSNAQKATNRAGKLTDQLLTFSKGGDPIKGVSSLPKIITESVDFVLHGSQISCHYNFPDDLWMVDVDSGQIGQVIQNIVLNAKYATPAGGTITVECANMQNGETETIPNMAKGNYVRINIEDTGVGVPEEIINKVFDPYFTTKDTSSGLGLAICYSIISKHDGHIIIQSQTGKGTTLSIYLPASPSTDITVAKQKKALPACGLYWSWSWMMKR